MTNCQSIRDTKVIKINQNKAYIAVEKLLTTLEKSAMLVGYERRYSQKIGI